VPFFVGFWTGQGPSQYVIAGVLLGMGIVFWGGTVWPMQSRGEAISKSGISGVEEH